MLPSRLPLLQSVLVDRPNAPQSTISAGVVLNRVAAMIWWPPCSKRGIRRLVLSRINTDLRETKGWSYGVFSGIGVREPDHLLFKRPYRPIGPVIQSVRFGRN
ncbi:MAG: hypothetical protein IPP45_06665 [Sphingomonadales bacterium]|nr:hypothetical protein [Sphingomonadales bacterium]